ncbi:MAG: mobile mystery protein B [Patescibacteria group bacterium]
MGLNLDYIDGQSILTEDEKDGLKITSISTHQELDEFEQKNIEEAIKWLLGKKITADIFLSEKFIKDLHFRMFGFVWGWAGTFRKSNKNIGIDWSLITTEIRKLLDDCSYWFENQTFSEEEIAIRFSHRLVWIHPFPNGNGRHSRLMADIMMEYIFNKSPFPWGGKSIKSDQDIRDEYLTALHEADNSSFERLIRFAK